MVVAIETKHPLDVQMNTNTLSPTARTARVAIDVRLFFDVLIDDEDESAIRHAACRELERVEAGERLRVLRLWNPNVYLPQEWSDLSPTDFRICQRCDASEVNRETRFPL